MKLTSALFILSAGVLALPVSAGPVADAEAALRGAYGSYRAALFLSNQNKAPETAQALVKFDAAWDGLAAAWQDTPPPQYADDTGLSVTFGAVNSLIEMASAQVAGGDMAAAHATLEEVRDEIGALHTRNGLIGFSDRMNAYHAAMEEVLAADYAALGDAAPAHLMADAKLLDYLAAQIVAHPAPEADDPAYVQLVAGFGASVAAFRAAAEAGDVAAGIAAQGQLKVPYSKLFAKFG
ncbi:hypothetical protein RYZ20_09415 [Thioclava sp. A2]|uniref:hypothetical protein n=1 Tax=Thioclava sp. FCG-A2 TaxID=3080562 RepID=UPI0029556011|nr:hypothetical protein [Thioclava sp. A2]MDV7271118.1 hypothetical protein [Thioclava sp. A2]